ncbi:ABC transporter ATP-binding protein [Loigolactobacillus zhaoyuanensis]|uniref:ABC transporter ATP-binding protein n=1 Tax=Loigolactobacillus zhaoyuanensis TaxID=2486017 RepID=A0ABW8UCY7_9LACO|nr:ATP-binding cassette domain-containing protein [Loigolactobacillus zhaoyuanensis]
MVLLEARNVGYKYPRSDDQSISQVSLALNSNSLNVIIGPSGIGKSTLLNLIAGYAMPQAGELLMNGARITQASWQRGIVFQDMALYPWLNVSQNITFGPRMRKLPATQIEQRLTSLLTQTGLLDFKNKYVYELSGGLRQRVALAREFINQPAILMLDESFSALDNHIRKEMHQILLDLWTSSGNCVIVITHDIDEALFLGQKIIVMNGDPGTIKQTVVNPYFKSNFDDMTSNMAYFDFRRALLALIE